MSDLESGNFLYENRDRCNQIATLQVFIFSLSFVFTYQVWWCGITGIGLGLLGYFASSAPVVQNKVKLMTIYYYGNWVLLVGQFVAAITSATLAYNEVKDSSMWGWIQLIIGSLSFFVQGYLLWYAIKQSHMYKSELLRNPPPMDHMVNNGAYKQVPVDSDGPARPM